MSSTPKGAPSFTGAGTVLEPRPDATAVLGGLRHSDMYSISERLGRLCNAGSPDRHFGAAAALCFGGLIGGLFGLIPFYSAEPGPDQMAQVLYFAVLSLVLLAAVIASVASVAIREVRTESAAAIKEDLDRMLNAYDLESAAQSVAGTLALQFRR